MDTPRDTAATDEMDEDAGPSSPSQPTAGVEGLQEDFEHFTFLQSVIQKGFMPENEARDMYRQLADSDTDDGYEDFIADINEPLTFLHLKLKRTIFNLDGEWYIAFVNELPDETSKGASTLEIPQRAYFQTLMEAIATNDNSEDGKPWLRSVDAVNINLTQTTYTQMTLTGAPASQAEGGSQGSNTRLTHAEKEDTLKQLVAEGWLAKTSDRAGCYSIGVRTFLELGQYLTELDLPQSTRNVWQKFL